MGSLPSLAQEMLRYAAACPRPTVELLEAALERSPLEPLLADAVDAGIVARDGAAIRFTHPIYRSAIYADSSREHRHRIHRRLSAIVDDGEERARHLALAADGTDDAAASSLEHAAEEARARGSTAAAAELCELAERLTPPDRVADVLRIRSAAAQDLLLAGDHERAVGLFESVAAGVPPGAERAGSLLHLGRALVVLGDERRAADVLTQALREDGVPSPILSSIHAWRSYACASLGDLRGALGDAEEAVRLAGSAGDPGLGRRAHRARRTRVWLGQGIDEALMTEALALESSSAPRPIAGRSRLRLASLMSRTGAIGEGRSMCEALLVEAVGSGDEDATGLLHAELGWVEFLAGDWEASLDHLVRAVGHAPDGASGLGALALLEAHLGDVDAARSHALEGLEASERSGAVEAEILALSAMGAIELSSGNASAAREPLERAWRRHRGAGFGEPAMFPFVADLATVLVEVEARDAAEIVDWLEERGRALDRPWALGAAARARALMWATGGDLPAALDACAHALDNTSARPMPFERARTLMLLGSIRRRAKQKKPARTRSRGQAGSSIGWARGRGPSSPGASSRGSGDGDSPPGS